MVEIWFGIFWGMIAAYAVLDGRNLGAAALRQFVASNADERRQVLDAIGPLWTWHEVWLVAAGGVLLLAFPAVLASAFAGYYLALFLVIWLLIARGVSMEVGGHVAHPLWQAFWDFVLSSSSALLALLLGLAFGNIIRGVPLDSNGEFHMAFFTDFTARGHVGLIDWYTLSVGALSLVTLAAHGATYLMLTTEGPVRDRSKIVAQRLWLATLSLGLIVTMETWVVRPDLWAARPLTLASVVLAATGGLAILNGFRAGLDLRAYAGSCMLIAGVLAARAAASFPIMLHSTLNPEDSLSAYRAAARHESLVSALPWWIVAAIFSLLCATWAGRNFRGTAFTRRKPAVEIPIERTEPLHE
jgi:cytochrome d ubiquinol oxidase subunit II